MRHPTDSELLSRTATDPDSFGEFYARHERSVLRFFVARVRDAETAADLCAETFAQALISIDAFDPERGTPSSWLFGIAGHLASRHHRSGAVDDRARRRLGIPDVVVDDEQVEAIARLESEQDVAELLDELPPGQRAAVRARVLDGSTYAEMAADAEESEIVLRQRVSRGLAALRPRLTRRSE